MGTRERRDREKRRRRRDILDAARQLFWQHGYAGTTMPQIAGAAQLAPGTLYLYFPSKSALYAELLLEGYDLLLERLGAELNREAPARERAEALMELFFAFARDHPEYFDVIFFVLQSENRLGQGECLEPQQIKRLQAREAVCKAIAAQMLQQAGYPASGEKLRRTVDAIWSMLVGTIFYFRKAGAEQFSAVAQEAKRLILDASFGQG